MFPSILGNKNGSVLIFAVQSCVHYIIITEPFEPGLLMNLMDSIALFSMHCCA